MRRERTTNDRGATSPRRPEAGNQSDSQVPIESDADAGFASRSRRTKMTKDRGLTAREIFGDVNDPSRSVRRRKPSRNTAPSHPRAASDITVSIPAPDNDRPSAQKQSQNSPSKGYAASLSDAFRHVRASSLSAFGQSGAPFRTVRFGSDQEIGPPAPRPKSNLSITRWFGGASESSSESESEDETGLPGSGSGPSGDEAIPTFRVSTDDQVVIDDDDEDSEDEGEIPIPGGERVNVQTIDAGAAAGERLRPVRHDSPEPYDNPL